MVFRIVTVARRQDAGEARRVQLKTSFKLKADPFKNPRTADEWEPYTEERRRDVNALARQLADAEAEINHRVYRLFNLSPEEIKLLEKEVEH
jgi:hypothetical protein